MFSTPTSITLIDQRITALDARVLDAGASHRPLVVRLRLPSQPARALGAQRDVPGKCPIDDLDDALAIARQSPTER